VLEIYSFIEKCQENFTFLRYWCGGVSDLPFWQVQRRTGSFVIGRRKEILRHGLQKVEMVGMGIDVGRRPELVGGGLIKSLGGWDAVKKIRFTGQDRIKFC